MYKIKCLFIVCFLMIMPGCSKESPKENTVSSELYNLSIKSANGQLRYHFPVKPLRSTETVKTYFGQVYSIQYMIKYAGLVFEIKESHCAGFNGSDDRLMEYDSGTFLSKATFSIESDIAFHSAGFSVREIQANDAAPNSSANWSSWAVKDSIVYKLSVSGMISKDHKEAAKDFFKRNLFWHKK